MKRANVSLFAAFLAMALLSGMSVARAQDFYMDLHVGYNIVDNGDLEYGTGSFPTGYEQRSAVRSATWDPGGFRIEAEITCRSNDINYIDAANAKGQLASFSMMINMFYELRIGGGSGYSYGLGSESPFRPDIGVGGGGARYTMDAAVDLAAGDIIDDATYGTVYQGIPGLGVEVTETTLVTLDFRYLVSENVKFRDVAGAKFEIDSNQATAMFGL